MKFQKLYDAVFNLSHRNINLVVQVVDGNTLISLPGCPEQVLVLEGHRVELVVSASAHVDAPVILSVSREAP